MNICIIDNLEISTGVGEKGLIKAFIDTCLSNEW